MTTMFQSTRPRGARQTHPRPEILLDDVSIHAPARGATPSCTRMKSSILVSIHAPARGATWRILVITRITAFQSTRPRGARPEWRVEQCEYQCFNPRARAGRDSLP